MCLIGARRSQVSILLAGLVFESSNNRLDRPSLTVRMSLFLQPFDALMVETIRIEGRRCAIAVS
jgi:hypothetical protein